MCEFSIGPTSFKDHKRAKMENEGSGTNWTQSVAILKVFLGPPPPHSQHLYAPPAQLLKALIRQRVTVKALIR